MNSKVSNVVILGATGSIGKNALQVIAAANGKLNVLALSSHRRLDEALEQCIQFQPKWLIATDDQSLVHHDFSRLPPATELLKGAEHIAKVVSDADTDVVVSAIVGSAGLAGTVAALQAGKRVALANKESLVMAGKIVMQTAKDNLGQIIPVDSEHSAIFQALKAGHRSEVKRVLLTASGGPFLRSTGAEMANATIDEALAHPTWSMGKKISIDSATMMNKALEIIEARWLFDLQPAQIEVVVHPESIVHSFVEFNDGSVIAQLSPPDMKLPIQYALTYPERSLGVAHKVDWMSTMNLSFEPPDMDRFPALSLGLEVAQTGGTAGAVLNAANETAVQGFLDGHLRFAEIVPFCRSVLQSHNYDPDPTLSDLIELDRWAREEVSRRVC